MNRKAKRILSIILVVALCVLQMPYVFAENNTLTVRVSSVAVSLGDSVTVTIDLKNNPGLTSLKFDVSYDSVLTLEKVEFNSAFGSMVTAKEPYTNPQTLSFISPFEAVAYNGTFATLTFKTANDIQGSYDAAVMLNYSADDILDGDDETIPVIIENGVISISSECLHENVQSVKGKEPNCLVPGLTSGLFCPDCNTWVTAQKEIPAIGHNYDSGRVTTKPSCTDFGVRTFTCLNDPSHTYTESLQKTAHYFEETIVAPTCILDGYTEHTCIYCGYSYKENSAATHHVSGASAVENEVQATCNSDGSFDEVVFCSICGEEISRKTIVTNKTGHKIFVDESVKPTCSEAGLTEGSHCLVCGTVIKKQETVAKKAHSYKNVITKADATKKRSGNITPTCSVCGYKKTATTIYYPKTVTLSYSSKTYTGKALKPTVTVKDSKGKTISSKYYTVSYKNNTNVGKATVTITFKGNYTGKITKTFTINPKGTSISKLSAKSKGFTATWKKQTTQTTGYEIQYSTSSKFTSKTTKTIKITSAKAVSKTVSKLKASSKYYVRVRTYKTVSKTNYYSAWSKALSVTTKK